MCIYVFLVLHESNRNEMKMCNVIPHQFISHRSEPATIEKWSFYNFLLSCIWMRCSMERDVYGKMKAFCDTSFWWSPLPTPPSKKSMKRTRITIRLSEIYSQFASNIAINQELLIIIDANRSCGRCAPGSSDWPQMASNVLMYFSYQIQSDIQFRKKAKFFAPDVRLWVHRRNASIKIGISDRPITISKSVTSLNASAIHCGRLQYETKWVSIERDNWRTCFRPLRRCAVHHSPSVPLFHLNAVRHLTCFSVGVSNPSTCLCIHGRPQSVHSSYRSASNKWLIMAFLSGSANSRAKMNKNTLKSWLNGWCSHSWCNKFVTCICMHTTSLCVCEKVNLNTLSFGNQIAGTMATGIST